MRGQVGEDDLWEAGAGGRDTGSWRPGWWKAGSGGGSEGDQYENDYGSQELPDQALAGDYGWGA